MRRQSGRWLQRGTSRPWSSRTPGEIHQICSAYCDFPVILNEMRWARPHDGSAFPFMRLPVELRLEIYRYLLVQDSPIELWPHVKDNMMYNSNTCRRERFRTYRLIKSALRLLRVSRTVNEEAADVFYGENEFRFSGINGWMVFSAFLNTIKQRHYKFLKHITLHVAFPGEEHLTLPMFGNRNYIERPCTLRKRQRLEFEKALKRYGLKIPRHWTYDWAITDCLAKLQQTNLSAFQLVLPPTYCITHDNGLMWYWKQFLTFRYDMDAKREQENKRPLAFNFIFLKLRDSEVPMYEGTLLQGIYSRYTGQCKGMLDCLRRLPLLNKIAYGVYDGLGHYDIVDKETCRALTGPKAIEKEDQYEFEW